MKRITFISLIIGSVLFSATACIHVSISSHGSGGGKVLTGNGVLKEKERGQMDFSGIDTRGTITVVIADAKDVPVSVSGDENLIDSIEVYVKNDILHVHFKNNFSYSTRNPLKVIVPNNGRINRIKASGSSDVLIKGLLVAGKVSLSGSGSSDITGNIQANECELDFKGSSDFKGRIEAVNCHVNCLGSSDCIISGKADNCKISMSGSSDFKGYDFIVKKFDCNTSGSSDVQITCNEELSVHASGSSDVHYKGTARVTNVHTSGASDLHHKD
jgi:hypothetical protein